MQSSKEVKPLLLRRGRSRQTFSLLCSWRSSRCFSLFAGCSSLLLLSTPCNFFIAFSILPTQEHERTERPSFVTKTLDTCRDFARFLQDANASCAIARPFSPFCSEFPRAMWRFQAEDEDDDDPEIMALIRR